MIAGSGPQGSYFISRAGRWRLRSVGEMRLVVRRMTSQAATAPVRDARHRLVVGPTSLTRRRSIDLRGQNPHVRRGRTNFPGLNS
jgi:hypothetical protein